MMSIIRALFYKMPKVGDVYISDSDDPFDRQTFIVEDVKDGWVKYRGTTWKHVSSSTTSLSIFHSIMVKYDGEVTNG
jgi:hypothetical protein